MCVCMYVSRYVYLYLNIDIAIDRYKDFCCLFSYYQIYYIFYSSM